MAQFDDTRLRRPPFTPDFVPIWQHPMTDTNSHDGDFTHDHESNEAEDIATAALRSEEALAERAEARAILTPAMRSLQEAGFYAYLMLDEENRWQVAADDEAGRVSVHYTPDGYEVTLWGSSPGLYADEENPFRRRSLERLARITIPRIARGFLEEHQSATWDEVDQGVAVTIRYELPYERANEIGAFVRAHFNELDDLLTLIETQLAQ